MEINAKGQRFVTTPVESIGNCALILNESIVLLCLDQSNSLPLRHLLSHEK
jgi:hypothetical protein